MSRDELLIGASALMLVVFVLGFLWILTRVEPSIEGCTCTIGGGHGPIALCVVHMLPPRRARPAEPERGKACPFCEGTGRYDGTAPGRWIH